MIRNRAKSTCGLLALTNRNLLEEVEAGRFRRDLSSGTSQSSTLEALEQEAIRRALQSAHGNLTQAFLWTPPDDRRAKYDHDGDS